MAAFLNSTRRRGHVDIYDLYLKMHISKVDSLGPNYYCTASFWNIKFWKARVEPPESTSNALSGGTFKVNKDCNPEAF